MGRGEEGPRRAVWFRGAWDQMKKNVCELKFEGKKREEETQHTNTNANIERRRKGSNGGHGEVVVEVKR